MTISLPVIENGEIESKPFELRRGMPVRTVSRGDSFSRVRVGLQTVDLDNRYLADTLKEALLPDQTVTSHDALLYLNRNSTKLAPTAGLIPQNTPVEILDVDLHDYDEQNGEASWYKVRVQGQEGYMHGGALRWISSQTDPSPLPAQTENTPIGSSDLSAPVMTEAGLPEWAASTKNDPVRALNVSLAQLVFNEAFLEDYIQSSGFNTLIVTLKDTDGLPAYSSETFDEYFANADWIDRQREVQAADFAQLHEVVSRFKERGIRMVGRIDVFCDDALASLMPDAVLEQTSNGIRLAGNNPSIWCYIGRLEQEAIKAGFQEILLDSVIPDDGTTLAQARLGGNLLDSFLKTNREALDEHHARLSVMVPPSLFYESEQLENQAMLQSLLTSAYALYAYPWLINLQQHPENYGIEVFTNARNVIRHFAQCANGASSSPSQARLIFSLQGFGLMSPETLREQLLGLSEAGADSYAVNTIDGDPNALLPLQKAFIQSKQSQ